MNNQPTNHYHHLPTNPFYQPQYITPPVFTTHQEGLNYQILHLSPVSPFAHRSPWLFRFGVFDVVISGIMFIWTITIAIGWSTAISICVTMPCAIFHLVLGIVSIVGSRDGIRYRSCIIVSLVLGIIGPCFFICATLTADIIQWDGAPLYCTYCAKYMMSCPSYCYMNRALLFVPIIVYSVIQGIVSVVLSSISCCNLCRCCGCCYMGELRQQPLLYTSAPSPYVALAVPQTVPHNVPTDSDEVAELTQPNYKNDSSENI